MEKIKKISVCIISLLIISIGCFCSCFSLILVDHSNLKAWINNASGSSNIISDLWKAIYKYHQPLNQSYFNDNETSIYKLNNGWFSYAKTYNSTKKYSSSISEFKKLLDDNNIQLCYAITAECGDERQHQLPYGISIYQEKTNNELFEILKQNSIDYFDTYKLLSESNKDYYSYFYKTDHHWNNSAGHFVAQSLIKEFNKNYNFGLDETILNIENFDEQHYSQMFLGSIGKKLQSTFLYNVTADDFDIFYPNFETNFDIKFNGNTKYSGPYNKTILSESHLYYDLANNNTYCAFLHGDHSLINIHNNKCENNKKILILKDSKANVVNSYLSLCFEYMDIIDPRPYKDSIKDYITNTQPDLVLFLCSSTNGANYFDIK